MRKSFLFSTTAAVAVMLGIAVSLPAISTKVLTDQSLEDFQQGELKSTSLTSDGVLTIAPALKKISETGEPVVWDVVPAAGKVYISTGHDGKVFAGSAQETSPTLVCDLKEVEATALTLSPNGELFVGASPGGKIYRVANNDKPTTFSTTRDSYVWDLLYGENQTLYAATGAKGNIYTIDAQGKATVLLETKTANVLSLAQCGEGSILASTEDPGLVLQIFKDRSVKVLIDASPYSEVRKVICGKDGVVYAILNGTGEATPEAARIEALRAALGSLASDKSKQPPTAPAQQQRERRPPAMSALESQIVKINPNGFVQTIWFAPESPIQSIHYDATTNRLYAGVGEKGLLYEVSEDGKSSRALEVPQRSIMTLAGDKAGLLVGTAESGTVYSLSPDRGLQGVFLSRALDAGDPVKWGSLRVTAAMPEGTSLTLAMRRGNSSEPDDKLWTKWTDEITPKNDAVPAEGTPARFLQYRATLSRKDALSPSPALDKVEAFYLTPNLAPVIKDLTIGKTQKRPAQQPGQPRQQTLAALLMQTPEAEEDTSEAKPVAPEPNSNSNSLEIQWEVEEPNEDKLEADVFFKGENETTWKKLNKEPIRDKTSYTFVTATIPDGEYRARVVINDKPSNPPEHIQSSERISDRFYVDNTPPEVKIVETRQLESLKILVIATAADATTMVADAMYNVNAGEWNLAFPMDRIFDARSERFEFTVEFKEAGEHTLTLMTTDRQGNTALAKHVVNVAEQ